MSQESTIRRGVRNARYAAIPNHVFEDSRLSMEARWLLSYLLSKPDNWTVVIGDICKRGGCGRDKARGMIAELVKYGYAEREQQRADGKFGASVLVIFDEPREAEPAGNMSESESVAFLPQTDLPATALPSPVSPSPVKSAHSNNLDLANTDHHQERGIACASPDEDPKKIERKFKAWYPTWPSYLQSSEDAARIAFVALTAEERAECIGKTPAFIAAVKATRQPRFTYAAVFLKERAWQRMEDPKDEIGPQTTHAPFSQPWMALLLAEVSKPMATIWPAMTIFQRQQASSSVEGARAVEMERRSKYGWPKASRMVSEQKPMPVPALLVGLSEQFVGIDPKGDLAASWQVVAERLGWPWPTSGFNRLQVPAGPPEEAMDEFQKRLNEGKGYDDAA